MTGRIVVVDWITRPMLRANPEARFVFGDNAERVGLGGQAGAMRGEPNAIGVATKWAPGGAWDDYYSDEHRYVSALQVIDADIGAVAAALSEGRTVYVPKDGLGTGLSELPQRAPKLHAHIVERFRELSGDPKLWASDDDGPEETIDGRPIAVPRPRR